MIFYNLKIVNNDWYIIFLDENDNYELISNDKDKLVSYFNKNKDKIFIGANIIKTDDIKHISSIIKDGKLYSSVSEKDENILLPKLLDITQGIVRNDFVSFNTIICSIWDGNKAMKNFYALTEDEIEKELVFNVGVIKQLYDLEERKKFINWKIELIEKYNLPKNAYLASFGRLMEYIIELNVDNHDKYNMGKKFVIDSKLSIELEMKNDKFLNDILDILHYYYENDKEKEIPPKMIGECLVKFNQQGILGSKKTDHIDVDEDNIYLYIDFNSFGPNILINNGWLKDVSKHPERYKDIKDLRIELKNKNELEQLFYKYILNAGLDDLSKVYTKDGANIGLSLSITGIMTMLLLYRNIEQYGIELIECNTDGLIVRCPKKYINDVKNEVSKMEEKLALSCDVDVIKKIVHFDEKNYVIEYENGKIKNLGVFGLFQNNPLNSTGIKAVDTAIRNYYLYDIPVGTTLRKFRDLKDLRAFQIIKKQKSNEKDKYLKIDDEYIFSTSDVNRLFAVRKDRLNNPFYVKNNKNDFEIYKTKKGRRVGEGYAYFEVADRILPSIDDIDLTFYIDKCYKVIDSHPKKINLGVNINLNKPLGYAFFDIDGTLVKETYRETEKQRFDKAISHVSIDTGNVYDLFCQKKGNLLTQFLSKCRQYKAYGTEDNFATFLMEKELIPNNYDIEIYKLFVEKYLQLAKEAANETMLFSGSKEVIEKLKSDGFELLLYSDFFKVVQEAKLDANGILHYFSKLCTIDEYYAKSSVKGWNDVLQSNNIDLNDLIVMIGNSSSDIVPKTIGIPSIIIDHNGNNLSQTVTKNGIIIKSFDEISDQNFVKDIAHIKSKIKGTRK